MSEVTAVPLRPIAKGSVLKLWLALILLVAAGAGLAWVGTAPLQRVTTPSGLQYQVLKEGTGPTVQAPDLVRLHYTGRLENGTVFDSSVARGQPMETGISGIIPGFAEGLQRMRKGGRYRLWIPPELGYNGNVPQGAPFGPRDTLQFDIEVIDIAPGLAAAQQMQQMQQLQQMMQGGGGPGGAPGGAPGEAGAPPPGAPPGAPAEDASGRGRGGR